MKEINAENLVLKYFKGVDEENISSVLDTLTEDCVFSIETNGIKFDDGYLNIHYRSLYS